MTGKKNRCKKRKDGGRHTVRSVGLFVAAAVVWMVFLAADVHAKELGDYDYETIDETVSDYNVSFMDIAKLVMEGKFGEALKRVGQAALYSIFGGFSEQKAIIVKLLLLGIVGAVFKNISGAFLEAGVVRTGEYIVRIALVTILTSGIVWAADETKGLISGIINFMEALIPTYALVITAGSGSATAIAFYELVLLIIFLVDKIMLQIVIPGISIYMMINMMNYMSKDSIFGRLCELIAEMLGWANKTLLAFVVGLNIIKSLISPMLDSLKGTAFTKAVGLIPGVGGTINAVTGVVIGSGALIKNTVGVTAMLFLVMFCAMPTVKLFVFTYGCKAAGALLEPVSDKSYTECINGVHEGLKLLMVSALNVTILFLLTIAIVCATSNAAFYSGT